MQLQSQTRREIMTFRSWPITPVRYDRLFHQLFLEKEQLKVNTVDKTAIEPSPQSNQDQLFTLLRRNVWKSHPCGRAS